MKQRIVLLLSPAVWLLILVAFPLSSSSAGDKGKGLSLRGSEPTPTLYNPYPPGILPADLDSEIMVQHEIQGLEAEAMTQAQALPTPRTLDRILAVTQFISVFLPASSLLIGPYIALSEKPTANEPLQ